MNYTDEYLQNLVDEKPQYLPLVRDLAYELLKIRKLARAVAVDGGDMYGTDDGHSYCIFCPSYNAMKHAEDCPFLRLYNAVKEQG